jgi:hypothetical protein
LIRHRVVHRLVRNLILTLLGAGYLAVTCSPAGASGTARIQQRNGSVKIYTNVRIKIDQQSMSLTSSDGKGTVYIGKAACTKLDELVRCFPYDATLDQGGKMTHIALQSGTVWLNPTSTKLPLPNSSTQLPPHGVMLSMQTKAGTYVSLTGTVDEIKK